MADWSKKISGLKKLVESVGSLWPSPSTKLAGYAEEGPYHCEDCEYLRGRKKGNIFRDKNRKGRCGQEVMIADPDTKKDADGYAIVNIEKGCCEFVDPNGIVQIGDNMEGKKKHKFTHTRVELHDDGSASIHHVHEEGAHKDVKHAVADLDGVHDSLEEHLNPEEEDLEEKVHPGIHKIAEMMGGDEEKNEELVHPGIHHEIMKAAGKGE